MWGLIPRSEGTKPECGWYTAQELMLIGSEKGLAMCKVKRPRTECPFLLGRDDARRHFVGKSFNPNLALPAARILSGDDTF